MTSTVSWLDFDLEARNRALALVDVFREKSAIDELGIGTVRDAFARLFFPAVSVLQTRARYFVFIPRQLAAAGQAATLDAARRTLRDSEVRLIYALIRELGDRPGNGILGRIAKGKLKRMPSSIYWAPLQQYGIVRQGGSIDSVLRQEVNAHKAIRAQGQTDELGFGAPPTGLDPELLRLGTTKDWLTSTNFELTPQEASYLRDRIMESCDGSLYAWILRHHASPADGYLWDQPWIDDTPYSLRQATELARQFSMLTHGAAILYNLMLAELEHSDQLAEDRRADLETWQQVVANDAVWDSPHFWAVARSITPRISSATQAFADTWCTSAPGSSDITSDPKLRALIERREVSLKGARAKLVNPKARQDWRGDFAFGMGLLEYNWSNARQIIRDIQEGLGSDGAES